MPGSLAEVVYELLSEAGKHGLHLASQSILLRQQRSLQGAQTQPPPQGGQKTALPSIPPVPAIPPLEVPPLEIPPLPQLDTPPLTFGGTGDGPSAEAHGNGPVSVRPPSQVSEHSPASKNGSEAASEGGSVSESYSAEWGEDLSIACAACTMRHLGAMHEALRSAAEASTSEERRRNLAIAAGEGLVWLRYDMTPDKVARTPTDKRAAVLEARRQVEPILQDMPKAPERLVLAWAATGEALRFARSPKPTEKDQLEVEARMQDVVGLVGYLETDLAADPKAQPHLAAIREARHRWTRDGFTPDALAFAEERLGAAAVALTPDPGPAKAQELARRAKAANDAFFRAFLAAKRKAGPESSPDIERINLRGAFVDRDTRPPDAMVQQFTMPRDASEALGATPETKEAFQRLAAFNQARNVPVRDEPLPMLTDESGGFGAVLGAYFPDGDNIFVGPQAVAEAPKDVYTLAEETAHSLLHNRRCNVWNSGPGVPYDEMPEEREAKAAAMLALLNAGLPFETDTGRRINPQRVKADLRAMEESMSPRMLGRVVWAADVIQRALRGDIEGAVAASRSCPR
jgi:hypothetical protein